MGRTNLLESPVYSLSLRELVHPKSSETWSPIRSMASYLHSDTFSPALNSVVAKQAKQVDHGNFHHTDVLPKTKW